ncbi:SGNH/GDSL hydrolase family protein [Streptomyces sp. BK239]|uniref:SGNH/GDSL hydrolase family protein n=1 Tax=Streptomyces sp. BK239 TaxID=2512155 RepID=UPI00102B82CD|nr:SGNH/GDSL hydrolase family protein [Streptomyces sp. BK239]RZU24658.1 lysophospholipase L1-like esterase [Streptomyces sp. BK239]
MSATRHIALPAALLAVIVSVSAVVFLSVDAADGRHGDSPGTVRPPHGAAAPAGVWVGTWAAAPVAGEPGTRATGMAGRTVRNVVHTSVSGTSARITLSNLYGTLPLRVTAATLAVADDDGGPAAADGTLRRLTFGGRGSVVVPAGGQAVSDAVALDIPGDCDVLVSTYTPASSGPVTYHPYARRTSYVAVGEHTGDTAGDVYTGQIGSWRYLTALDVLSHEADGTVVAFGDSLTDGVTSTLNADRRYPDVLSERLRAAASHGRDTPRYGVVNAGISSNRVLADGGGTAGNASGIKRFARDVLARPHVKAVVIDLGVNDILRHPAGGDADAILAGLRTLVSRAHAHGVKAVGATLMPFRGHHSYSDAREATRLRVNAEIRSGSVFDEVVDVDQALHDPYDPRQLRPEYDSGDHLHPSDLGYRRMAQAVELAQLKATAPGRL